MTLNIDNFYLYNTVNTLYTNSMQTSALINNIINDLQLNFILFKNTQTLFSESSITNQFISFYLDVYYSFLIQNNLAYLLPTSSTLVSSNYPYYIFFLLEKFFKINLFLFVVYTIFFITNFENYIKQLKTVNLLTKLFILNSTEKEVGPVDDYFVFAILFVLTISLFVFTSIFLIIIHSKIFIWAVGSLFLLTFLILTIPINLFIDFGIVFCVAIKGSASSNNFIKELLFDIISVTIVFIRFVIQNIRFFFIFAGIFELLEWVFSVNNSLFLSTSYFKGNAFSLDVLNNSFYSLKTFNYLFVNSLLFVVLYFYYILHLLFLLIVQVTVYVGVSVWLFFFLYSTKFLTKYERFFIFKKIH